MRIDQTDLEFISQHLSKKIEKLKNSRTFLTGGTGFFGKWLVESWIHLNQSFGLNAELLILSRDPSLFLKSFPHLQHPSIKWLKGDVRSFQGDLGTLGYCIHGATSASLVINEKSPFEMLNVTIEGTRNILKRVTAAHCKRFLLLSSGAIYGTQPPELTHLPETYMGGPNTLDPRSSYSEGKRISELMTALTENSHPVFLGF